MNNKEIDKAFPVPCDKKSFYRLWLSFLTPVHHFTPQVTQIAGELLRHREELSKNILDESMLTKFLMSADIRNEILRDCDVSLSTFRVTLNKLKKAKFFVDGKINPKFIPNVGDKKTFNFALMFMINDSGGKDI